MRLTAKRLELPADVAWNDPDGTLLDEAQAQAFSREMAKTKGVDLVAAPSVVAQPGEPSEGLLEAWLGRFSEASA